MSKVVEFGRGERVREWQAFPHQAVFINATEDEVLFGGAAGPGKTDALIMWQIRRRLTIPGSRGLFLRRELRMLERNVIPRARRMLAGVPGVKWRGDTYTFTFSFKDEPDSVLQFGHIKDPGDEWDYSGDEYDDICFDELTEFTEDMYQFLLTRLRTTIPGVQTMVRSASNPLGIGHGWVKERFRIDEYGPGGVIGPGPIQRKRAYVPLLGRDEVFEFYRGTPFEQDVPHPYFEGQTIRRTFRYIPATVKNNPILVHLNPQYLAQLMELPEPLRSAYLYGDWSAYAGAFFQEFNRQKHVIKPFEVKGGMVFASMDWGSASPYSVHWYWVDEDNRIYVIDELYGWSGRANVGTREGVPEVAQKMLDLEKRRGYQVRYRVADPSMWAKRSQSTPSTAEEFHRAGVTLRPADNAREHGWYQVRQRLRNDSLFIFDRCTHLIRTLPALPPDPNNPEDLDTDAEDHAADDLRYACSSRPFVPQAVRPKPKPADPLLRLEQERWENVNRRRHGKNRAYAY